MGQSFDARASRAADRSCFPARLRSARRCSRPVAASSTQINLAWTESSTDATGFEIDRKLGAGGTYAVVAVVPPNVTTYLDAGLSPNLTYYYQVRALNFGADSPYSNEVSLTTPVPPQTPSGSAHHQHHDQRNRLCLDQQRHRRHDHPYPAQFGGRRQFHLCGGVASQHDQLCRSGARRQGTHARHEIRLPHPGGQCGRLFGLHRFRRANPDAAAGHPDRGRRRRPGHAPLDGAERRDHLQRLSRHDLRRRRGHADRYWADRHLADRHAA